MFNPNSRYYNSPTDTVTLADGTSVSLVRFTARSSPALMGYHQRLTGQRLDLIANFYFKDPTTFWKLCDANGTIVPDTLASRDLIGIPRKER